MLYLASYTVILFTLQLMLILSKTPSWWLITIWGLLFCLVYVWRKRFYLPEDHPHAWQRKRLVTLWLVALLFLAFSHLYVSYDVHKKNRSYLANFLETKASDPSKEAKEKVVVSVQGHIHSPITIDGNRVSFILKVTQVNQARLPQAEKVAVHHYVSDQEELARYKQVSRLAYWAGEISLAEPSSARNPGAFDYSKYLSRQYIFYVGRVENGTWQHMPNSSLFAQFLNHLDRQRDRWLEQIEQIFSRDVAPVVQALTVGYKDQLDPELMELYRQLGVVHILAISGLHVGIITWGLFRLLSLLPLPREKVYFLLLIFLPIYMYLSGGQVSAVRACLMGMVAIIFLRFHWWQHALLGLYLIYVVMLLYDASYLYHIGFQLSFTITFVLIVAYPVVDKSLSRWPAILRQLIGINLLAELASLPIILFHFQQFSPFSFLTNLVVVPIYSIFLIPCSFMFILLSFIHADLVSMPVIFYESIFRWLQTGLELIKQSTYAVVYVGRPSLIWIGIYMGIMLFFFLLLENGRYKQAYLSLTLIVTSILVLLTAPYLDRKAYITVLDVGQGEAILLEMPFRQEVVLIDTGGIVPFPREEWAVPKQEFEVGRDVLLPYLRYRGINRIDKLLITHGHFDHYGGIQGLLGEVKIKEVLRSPIYPQSETEEAIFADVKNRGIPIYSLSEGDSWGGRDYLFYVLFPEKREPLIKEVENVHDYNLVIWTQIYQSTFIWTGDVEEYGERMILAKYPSLQADVLSIAHHGSQTSTSNEWLDQLKPRVGLISLGRNNYFGHPHPEVLERLAEHRVTVYRTDQHGGIRLTIGPERLEIVPTLH